MIKWLMKKYTDYKMKNHISKERCFVFPIIPKEMLEDGKRYETFWFSKKIARGSNDYEYSLKIETAKWCAEKDCFLDCSRFYSYEDFKPIKKIGFYDCEKYNYDIVSYNPCDVNALDIEELKDIIFNVGDDTTIESDDIWEKLVKYMDDRGLSE